MSVYPVFDIEKISAWCTKDVAEFIQQEKAKNASLNLETGFVLKTEGLDTKGACETAIKPFVDFITSNLPKDKTYVDAISGITDPTIQNKLWIARTFLFSQLMIFAVAILGNAALYKEVFGEANGKTMFPFMPEVTGELPNYQMGIFGSKSPTSDIDVGIQYIGASTKPTLHYILYVFEQLFLTFTGKSSLDFDIEAYADLYLIRDDSGADYFYLDTGNFEQTDFVKVLPVAGLSIARNVLMDDPKLAINPTFEQIVVVVNDAVSKNSAIADKTYANFETSIGTDLMRVLIEPKWLSAAMDEMKTFLNDTHDVRRAKYYAAVLAAETKKFEIASTFEQATKLTNEQRCDLINLVGTALAYRMESYTSASTITHVVRILQANKEAAEKYKTTKPQELCSDATKSQNPAYCAIGKYGFVMSILEQMGYMCRFYQHYCVGHHIEEEKCNKKMKKYGDRYVDGFEKYKKYQEVTSVGGKRRTRRRNKNRKTLKHGKQRKSKRTRK
jgi:hypothetical protein